MLLVEIEHSFCFQLVHIDINYLLEDKVVHSTRMRNVFYFVQEN